MNVKAEAELMITSFVWNAAAQLRRQENLESHLYAKFGARLVRFLFGKSCEHFEIISQHKRRTTMTSDLLSFVAEPDLPNKTDC